MLVFRWKTHLHTPPPSFAYVRTISVPHPKLRLRFLRSKLFYLRIE